MHGLAFGHAAHVVVPQSWSLEREVTARIVIECGDAEKETQEEKEAGNTEIEKSRQSQEQLKTENREIRRANDEEALSVSG